jgi:hypothetical protein
MSQTCNRERSSGKKAACLGSGSNRSNKHNRQKRNKWRMRVSIPLPLRCKRSALPFELIPLVPDCCLSSLPVCNCHSCLTLSPNLPLAATPLHSIILSCTMMRTERERERAESSLTVYSKVAMSSGPQRLRSGMLNPPSAAVEGVTLRNANTE